MKIDENLNQIFNLEATEVATNTDIQPYEENLPVEVKEELVEVEPLSDSEEIENDFKTARVLLKNLIETNNTAIDQIGKIAITYENPRGFEVLGQLIKTQSELVKELMESHKKKQDLMPKKDIKQQIETQNNIVFTGSTSELMKAIASKK